MLLSESDSAVVQKVLKRETGSTALHQYRLRRHKQVVNILRQMIARGVSLALKYSMVLCLPWTSGSLPMVDKNQGRQSNIKPADAYYQALAECNLPDPEIGTDFGPSGKLETRCQRQHRNSTVEDRTHTKRRYFKARIAFDSSQKKVMGVELSLLQITKTQQWRCVRTPVCKWHHDKQQL